MTDPANEIRLKLAYGVSSEVSGKGSLFVSLETGRPECNCHRLAIN
jgi:hypothetical protein